MLFWGLHYSRTGVSVFIYFDLISPQPILTSSSHFFCFHSSLNLRAIVLIGRVVLVISGNWAEGAGTPWVTELRSNRSFSCDGRRGEDKPDRNMEEGTSRHCSNRAGLMTHWEWGRSTRRTGQTNWRGGGEDSRELSVKRGGGVEITPQTKRELL